MECESLESEMTEVQDFQCESPEADGQDDEDEVEELQNSLREVVQDPSVKPKLQCLMVDPSFSMVTVQSEDSGIVWETASSRCSTPWASETSSISEAYSMEGSGAQGKITIVFDEEKVIRRRTRSGGRSSRLSDRLRRPGSSRSASALGVERPEMAEVSIPNVKSEKTDAGPDLEEIKDKDQQLFSLISEGYEILNIRVPSKLPTVDEEESTELQDNLSYLDQTPRIKSRNHHGRSQSQGDDISSAADLEILEPKEDSAQAVSSTENKYVDTLKESACDIDYLEKYTLVDVVGLGAQAPAIQDEMNPPVAKPQAEMQKPGTETTTGSPCTSDDSFVFVTDVEISGEHLDDVFYGNVVHEALDDALHRRDEAELKSGEKMRVRRESQRSVKDNGSALFTSEETVLTPIFLSPGPPKIIDQILLEEPTAMSFMYSDLYEDAMGERRKSDEECSEAGSVASERPFRRRLSESEEADGYLEKFTLKDETPAVEVHADSDEDKKEGRMMWLQRTFDMSGCLTRVKEDVEEGKTKKEEAHEEDEANIDGCQSSTDYEKEEEQVVATAKAVIEREASAVFEDQAAPIRKRLEEPVHVSKAEEEKTESPELSVDVKRVQTEPDGSSGNNAVALPDGEELELERISADMRDEQSANESVTETQLPSQKPKVKDKTTDVVEEITDDASKSAVVPELVIKPDIQSDIKAEEQVPAEVVHDEDEPQGETGDVKEVCEEAAFVPELVDVVQKADKVNKVTEAKAEATTKVTETETKNQVIVGSIESVEKETPDEMKDLEAAAAKAADPAEMLSDNESVQTAVKAEEKGTEFETQIQVATREAMGAEISGVQVVSPEEEQRKEASKEETEVELPKSTSESVDAHQESELDNEIPSNIMQLLVAEQVKPPPDEILDQAFQPSQSQTEERVEELHNKELLFEDVKAKTNVDKSQPVVHEGMTVGDDLVLLVPKGKTIEMDIEIALLSEETEENEAVELLESESARKNLVAHEKAPESLPRPEDLTEDRPAELEPKTEPEYVPEEVVLPAKASLPAWVGVADAEAEEQKMDEDDEEEEEVFFPLRRGAFAPQEDLSGLRGQEETPGLEIHPDEYEPATDLLEVTQEDVGLKTQQHTEDVGPEVEAQRDIEENTSVTAEELDYEIITKQEAGEAPQPEMERAAVEPQPESADHENDRTATEIKAESEMEKTGLDLSPREEPIEADYDIIDAEEESQARAAAELQGMDWFCLACGCLLSEEDCVSGPHQDHKVTSVDRAYGDIKERLSDWISELQRRSENIQDLVSELELTYNSVEDECAEAEEDMRGQNEEMMTLVMEQYNGMSLNMEDEKKVKLEQLYDQIVSFQEIIDSAKVTLETTAREAETDARSPEDIETRLKEALKSATSQELGPKGLLVFEDYAKSNTSNSHLAQRKGIPVPLKPTLQPQEPGSATSTSVTAYWSVNPADVIDCFQVYCMEDPQGAVSEEYRVTVKESYCVLEELEPDRTYRVWVMAVNYSGCSLPSERLAFTTAPSVPVIDTERCTVLWDSATLRWDVADQTPGQSYTLEYCRQCELEGEGLRSISGIRGPEQKVLLQPNENYLFYIKAVNEGGSSEQSEAALVSTKGTRFHLLKTSAHPSLELSEDRTTLHYSPDTHCHPMAAEKQCPSILGELLPARGLYYWEAVVTGSAAYRVGVAYPTSDSNIPLGETSVSWCLHCTPTSSKYRLLHNGVQTDVLVIDAPQRVGVLLDYQRGRLSFYNAQTGQLLGRLAHRFARPCHPALGLAMPGSLALVMAPEVPEFASRS